MNKSLIWNSFGWGFILWLIGYVMGILLFAIVPTTVIGWLITPVGLAIMLWVLIKRITITNFSDYIIIAFVWTMIAIVLDYLMIVRLFKPSDGYYKLDVYFYYVLMFIVPLIVGLVKRDPAAAINE